MPSFREISEAKVLAKEKRLVYKAECLQFARRQIDGLAKHMGWPPDLMKFASHGVPKNSPHEWGRTFEHAIRIEDEVLVVSVCFETQRGQPIYSSMSVHKIGDVFVVTLAGVSHAIAVDKADVPAFWDSVSAALKVLAEAET